MTIFLKFNGWLRWWTVHPMWRLLMCQSWCWQLNSQKHGTAAMNSDPYCQNTACADAQRKRTWSSAATTSVNVGAGSTLGVSVWQLTPYQKKVGHVNLLTHSVLVPLFGALQKKYTLIRQIMQELSDQGILYLPMQDPRINIFLCENTKHFQIAWFIFIF